MAYTKPPGDSIAFNFTDNGYTPPTGDSLNFDFHESNFRIIPSQEVLFVVDAESSHQLAVSSTQTITILNSVDTLLSGFSIPSQEAQFIPDNISAWQVAVGFQNIEFLLNGESDLLFGFSSQETIFSSDTIGGVFPYTPVIQPEIVFSTGTSSKLNLFLNSQESVLFTGTSDKKHMSYVLNKLDNLSVIGNQKEILNSISINDSVIFKLLNQYGTFLHDFKLLLNEIKGVYENKTSSYVQINRASLLLNDFLSSHEYLLTSSALEDGVESFLLSISQGFQNVQFIISKLLSIDPIIKTEYLHNTVVLDQTVASIQGIISEGKTVSEIIKSTISDSEISTQKIINTVSNLSNLLTTQKMLSSMYKVPTVFSSITHKIYLDGSDISKYVKDEITIEKNQGNIHNSISFSSVSQELFNKTDLSVLAGEIRIEIHISNAIMYFLLEEKTVSSDGTVSYWGRDATARESAPWASPVSVSLSSWSSAKALCESLLVRSVLDWDILDWMLPDTYESTGTPIEVISEIVSEIGAIVRANDDGSLNVRYPYPIRPVDVKTAKAVQTYSSNLVYALNYSEEKGDEYNIVTVTADTADKTAPILEVEDAVGDSRIIGEETYIRAFYYEDPSVKSSILSQDKTDGIITFLKKDVQEITEMITFIDGKGSSSYPLKTSKTVSWLGRTNSVLTWDEYSTDISLANETSCLAEITYESEYHRYKASGHSVEELLTIFKIQSTFLSSIKVKTAPISSDKEGGEITTSFLTSQAALTKRGEIWIDSNKYDEETITFESPFVDTIKDGDIVWLEADRIPSGNYQIIDSSITISGPKIVNNMEVKKWQI